MNAHRLHVIVLRALLGVVAALGLAAAAASASAATATSAASATKVVAFDGWSARVPASWPVFRLDRRGGGRVCVRFDRHAVYLGRPGDAQRCPAGAAGRTEAVLVQPRGGIDPDAGAPGAGAVVVHPTGRVVVTATWNRSPGLVASALGVRSVLAAGRAYGRAVAAHLRAARTRSRSVAHARSGPSADVASVGGAGAVYTGLGFDACSTPSQATMTAWGASPFRAIGVYIGGANMACPQTNLTATWASAQAAAGWRLIPIYVGLQAPGNGCGCAAVTAADATEEGTAAAQGAVAEMQALGLGAGNPVYYDMENYPRSATTSQTVLSYLGAWTAALHAAGYASGVYGSEVSGIADLVSAQGTGYTEPDDIWVANWNGQQSTSDPAVPAADWPDHQRLHQYRGGHTDDYGGASLSIDSDYVDAATAAPGAGSAPVATSIAGAPTVSVAPQPDGTLVVTPRWPGNAEVGRWQVSAGPSATALSPVAALASAGATYLARSAWSNYSVQAYTSAGVEIGTSATVTAAPHVALYGHTAFVAAHGPGGIPVRCFGMTACRVATTVTIGSKRVSSTRPEAVPAGGGIVHFGMTSAWHTLIRKAGNAGIAVSVAVHAVGTAATSPAATVRWTSRAAMRLVRFTATGTGPVRVAGAATGIQILGGTDFVSHGWTGGILVACEQATPCTARPTVRVGAATVATASPQTISAGQIGYLGFRMTRPGHARLMRATGNQLGVSVAVAGAAHGLVAPVSAGARLALSAF